MNINHQLFQYSFSTNAAITILRGTMDNECADFWWGELVLPTNNGEPHVVDNIKIGGLSWREAAEKVIMHAAKRLNLQNITCEEDRYRLNKELERFPIYVCDCDCFAIVDSDGRVRITWPANLLRVGLTDDECQAKWSRLVNKTV